MDFLKLLACTITQGATEYLANFLLVQLFTSLKLPLSSRLCCTQSHDLLPSTCHLGLALQKLDFSRSETLAPHFYISSAASSSMISITTAYLTSAVLCSQLSFLYPRLLAAIIRFSSSSCQPDPCCRPILDHSRITNVQIFHNGNLSCPGIVGEMRDRCKSVCAPSFTIYWIACHA